MDAAAITRRRALALGAAAGAATLLARTPATSLAATSTFGMKAEVGRRLRAPRRFDLVGIKGDGLQHARVEIRTRAARGRWSAWLPVHAGGDHRPNGGTGKHASDPIWVDGAHEVELRADGRLPRDARLQFVAVAPLARRAAARSVKRFRSRSRTRQASTAPTIVPRASWGARAPRGNPGFGEVQMAFVHHTVTATDYGPQDVPAILQSIQAYHMDSNGWVDIGYNFLVDKYGGIWEGRAGGIDQPVIGAQAQGWNDDSTGISNIGTFTSVAQTPAAIEANARVIAWKLAVHAAPVSGTVSLVSGGGSSNKFPSGRVVAFNRISGHRDANSTSCPGDALYGQLGAIRARAAQVAGEYAGVTGRLTMIRSASAIRYGEPLVLTGQLRRLDGSPVSGGGVSIQKRGKSGWVTIGGGAVAGDGSYSASVAWRSTGRIRVRADIDGGIAVSPAASVYCIPRLSRMSKKARVGNRASVRGKVNPAETFKVLIERRSGGGYRRLGSYSVKARKSVFKARLPLRKAGRYKVTPIVKSGSRTFRGRSVLMRAVR